MKYLSTAVAVTATYLATTGTAMAGMHAALVSVSEPGIFPLLAMGAAITAVAYRLRRKK